MPEPGVRKICAPNFSAVLLAHGPLPRDERVAHGVLAAADGALGQGLFRRRTRSSRAAHPRGRIQARFWSYEVGSA